MLKKGQDNYAKKIVEKLLSIFRLFPISGTCKKRKRYYNNIVKRNNIKCALVVLLCTVIFTVYVVADYNTRNRLEGNIESNIEDGAVYEGRTVRIYANVESAEEGYIYQFSEVYNGIENIVQEYGPENGYAFVSTGIGVHVFYVDVQSEDGKKGKLSYQIDVKEQP